MHKNVRFLDFLKSLKFRFIILITAVIVIPGVLLCFGILNSYESRAVSIRESEVLSQAKILANQIATSDYLENGGADSQELKAKVDMLTTIYDGRVMVVDDEFKIITDTYNLDDNKIIISKEVVKSFAGAETVNYDSENHYIELSIPITNPDDEKSEVIGAMVVSVSTDNIVLNLVYLSQIAIIIEVILAAVALFLGIFCTIKMLKPFNKLSSGIEDIKTGYSEYNLEINDCTETRKICEDINSMLSSMKVMDDSRQEFVSNVSHELKTPLTSMKVLADSINSMGDEAPKELYQEFMGDITNEIERETKIINDLLSLVKMDKSSADLNIESVNINELIEQILKRLQPIAEKQQVEVVLESFRPVTAEVDEVKLSLAITNLVENAIKYNKEYGYVKVSLDADHQFATIMVEDNGIGIPEEAQEHIFERFYRVDKSHSREIGGTGLGLAIARNAILLHRGSIKIDSEEGQGTVFTVKIPIIYVSK